MTNKREPKPVRLIYVFVIVMLCNAMARSQDVPRDDASLPPLVTFDPEHQKALSYSDKSIEATLIVGRQYDSLKVVHLATKSGKSVDLPFEMAQVDEIRRVADEKLLVRGMVNGSGSEIVIIDLKTTKQIDKFLCYRPSVSPTGNYVAFIKFYPAHFAEGTEDHYMLYDLSKKPEDNRPKSVPRDDWANIGKGVYPTGVANTAADNIERPKGSQHQSLSGFFWNSNGKQFLFADRVNFREEINLVLVDIEQSGSLKIRTAQQDVDELCSKFGKPCLPFVRKVEFRSPSEPAFSVTFEIVNLHRLKAVQVNSDQFREAS